MLKLHRMSLGPLQTNCYLVGCDETKEAAIIAEASGTIRFSAKV